MRKIDYQALAEILREHIHGTDTAAAMVARIIARKFASRASVDAAAFLKACGID
jgi:3-methyladenine DNA glycosylase Tag